jgi:hypothetical protein
VACSNSVTSRRTVGRPAARAASLLSFTMSRALPRAVRGIAGLERTSTVGEDVILGAVTGTVERAQAAIVGRLTSAGQLLVVARSTVLTAAQTDQLASVLEPVDPDRHPWSEQISSLFGGPPVILRHVDPRRGCRGQR